MEKCQSSPNRKKDRNTMMKTKSAEHIMQENKKRFSKLENAAKIDVKKPLYKKHFKPFNFKKDPSKKLKTKIKLNVDKNFNLSVKATILFVLVLALYYALTNLFYSSQDMVRKADQYYALEDYFEAAKYYDKAIKLNSSSYGVYQNYGLSLMKLGNYNLAIEDFKKSLELDGQNPHAFYNLANAVYFNARSQKITPENKAAVYQSFMEAAGYLKQAINLDPKMKEAYVLIGLCYRLSEQYSEAVFWYNKALNLFPRAEFYNLIGHTFMDEKKYNEAAMYYRRAVDNDPSQFISYYNLGEAFAKLNDFNSALQNYKRALELDPDFTEGYIKTGQLYLDRQRYDEALAWFLEALKKNPDNMEASYFAGIAYESLGQKEEAEQYLRKAAYFGSDAALDLLQNMGIKL
jgi:tetratricopeptide (TPR) repeat protein